MKKIALFVALSILSTSAIASPASAAPFIPIGFAPSSDRQAITVEDLPSGPDFVSIIGKNGMRAVQETPENPRMCKSLTTDGCSLSSDADLFASSILPKCNGESLNCVESLRIRKPDGGYVDATFVKQFPGFTFEGIKSLDAPGGSTPSLWEAKGAPNAAGTEKYVVIADVGWNYRNSKVQYVGFSARVMPVKDTFGENFRPAEIMYHINPNTGKFQSNHDNGEQGGRNLCASTDNGYCAEKVDFVPGSRAELTLRVTNQVTGWLHGRISSPEISITPIDNKHNKMVVSGDPVEVPTMYAEFEKSKMSAEFLNVFENRWQQSGGFNGRSEWFQFNSSSPEAMYLVKELGVSAQDKVSGTQTYWTLKSIPNSNSSSGCLVDTKNLVGVVTTNAMAYSGSAPEWEKGFLNYKVAGLHFMPDGKSEVEGSYDLAIRSDAARCLYGFSKAPISATISVVGSAGEQKTAVTQVSEKDGWLKLTARGFTFSSPTISVKLSQPKASAKKTITCSKGKVTKKITAVGPKCPAGYKKK